MISTRTRVPSELTMSAGTPQIRSRRTGRCPSECGPLSWAAAAGGPAWTDATTRMEQDAVAII
eukprot:COSAG01_NODE_3226_length_6384_cov_10.417979_8_plen_63_part_00